MVQLAKFPKKEFKKQREPSASTYDKRMSSIKKLNGEFNGWWIYQYAMQDYSLRVQKNKMKRR
jgi:hypothetical protein